MGLTLLPSSPILNRKHFGSSIFVFERVRAISKGNIMDKELLLTPEGLEKLQAELKKLKEEDRHAVIERIRTAKEFGDLSENAEYEEAQKAQAFVEGRIQELEEMTRRAKVVTHTNGDGTVNVGSKVTIQIDGDQEHYEIVGATESDPDTGKISVDSPIGRELIGHKVGDEVEIAVPAGVMKAKILEIN